MLLRVGGSIRFGVDSENGPCGGVARTGVGRGDRLFAASGKWAVIPVTGAVILATGAVVRVTDPVMKLGFGSHTIFGKY